MIGRRGIALIEDVIAEMGSRFEATAGSEVGIDGRIELVDPRSGFALNQSLLVQSKAVGERFRNETAHGFSYSCEWRDVEHWLAGNAPTILVVSRPSTREVYFRAVSESVTNPAAQKTVTVRFSKARDRLDRDALPALLRLASQSLFSQRLANLPSVTATALKRMWDAERPFEAFQIAQVLGDERRIPLAALERLVEVGRPWMDGPVLDLLAQFAAGHGNVRQAAALYQRAAHELGDGRARRLALAAEALAEVDPESAIELVQHALDVEADDPLALWVRAALEKDLATAISIAEAQVDRAPAPTQWRVRLAGALAAVEQVDGAIRELSTALMDDPRLSGARLLRARCLAARAEKNALTLRAADLRAACEDAEEAVRARRVWRGPSGPVLGLACDLHLARGNFATVLTLGQPPPLGTAFPYEADDPSVVAAVAKASVAMGHYATALEMAMRLEASFDSLFVRAQVSAGQEDRATAAKLAAQAYERASDDGERRKAQLLAARFGGPIPGLESLREALPAEAAYDEAVCDLMNGRIEPKLSTTASGRPRAPTSAARGQGSTTATRTSRPIILRLTYLER